MKKNYIAPAIRDVAYEDDLLTSASVLDSSQNATTVTFSNEEYNDEFTSRRNSNLWDDED